MENRRGEAQLPRLRITRTDRLNASSCPPAHTRDPYESSRSIGPDLGLPGDEAAARWLASWGEPIWSSIWVAGHLRVGGAESKVIRSVDQSKPLCGGTRATGRTADRSYDDRSYLSTLRTGADHPAKPGLLRVTNGEGARIAVELWGLSTEGFGRFVAGIP
jgi:hypothetical protein